MSEDEHDKDLGDVQRNRKEIHRKEKETEEARM